MSTSRYLVVVLSPAFLESRYAQGELNSALHKQLSKGGVRVLPLLVGLGRVDNSWVNLRRLGNQLGGILEPFVLVIILS